MVTDLKPASKMLHLNQKEQVENITNFKNYCGWS